MQIVWVLFVQVLRFLPPHNGDEWIFVAGAHSIENPFISIVLLRRQKSQNLDK